MGIPKEKQDSKEAQILDSMGRTCNAYVMINTYMLK